MTDNCNKNKQVLNGVPRPLSRIMNGAHDSLCEHCGSTRHKKFSGITDFILAPFKFITNPLKTVWICDNSECEYRRRPK